MSDWSFARVWDAMAGAAPDREAVVCGPTRRTFGELERRAAQLASFLWADGLRPGGKVAINLTNRVEYLETFYAALARSAPCPVNVNYRYGTEEIRYLLDDSDAQVIVTEAAYLKDVRKAAKYPRPRLGQPEPRVLPIGNEYEQALRTATDDGWRERVPSGDDLMFLYTGGTTGMPKGVMWRNDDLYVALWQMGRPGTEPPDPLPPCSRASAPRPRSRRARSCTAPACSSRSRPSPAAGSVVLIDKVGPRHRAHLGRGRAQRGADPHDRR